MALHWNMCSSASFGLGAMLPSCIQCSMILRWTSVCWSNRTFPPSCQHFLSARNRNVKVNIVPSLEVDITKCFNAFEIYLDQYMLIYTDKRGAVIHRDTMDVVGAWTALEEHQKKYAEQQKRKRQKDLNISIGASLGNIFVLNSYCFTYLECRWGNGGSKLYPFLY